MSEVTDTYVAAVKATNKYMIDYFDGPAGIMMESSRWDMLVNVPRTADTLVVPQSTPTEVPEGAVGLLMGLPVWLWERERMSVFGRDELGQVREVVAFDTPADGHT